MQGMRLTGNRSLSIATDRPQARFFDRVSDGKSGLTQKATYPFQSLIGAGDN
jgi:hypothetical protein